MGTTGISSNSSFNSPWKHDVFLSFSLEEDTDCGNFTDHLYDAFHKKGINTFRAGVGSLVAPFKEIEESRFAIVVLSKKYASSTRCLDELVKIVECEKEQRLTVYPVIYHKGLEIDHGRGQLTNDFWEDFAEQHDADKMDKHSKWRDALTQLAYLSRWDLQGRHETEFIKEIVKDILEKLNQTCRRDDDKLLVGMGSRIEKMHSLLDIDSDDVRMIGIFGVQGIGKTTIAHQVFERIKCKFDATAFIANVTEECKKKGILHLQKRIFKESFKIEGYVWNDGPGINLLRRRLRSKRVLIILDGVDSSKQIQESVGDWKVAHYWLGPGSRVIVTSENKHDLLNKFGEKYIYEVDKLTDDEALQLLCARAFADNYILEGYREVCNNVVQIAQGNPSTLVNLGDFLRGRSLEEWSDKIAMLKEEEDEECY